MNKNHGGKLSFSTALRLAAPHTWPASVLPVLLGTAIHAALNGGADVPVLLLCLAAGVLLQSAVNTFNDYADFVSGLDTAENCPDSGDAALVYDCSSPRAALILGLIFLLLAALAGLGLLILCSPALLIYAAAGLAAILIYTLPAFSFSRLPLGELLSGGAMGGALCFAAYHAQSGCFSPRLFLLCLPALIMIGCIMLVNNGCDIEKDLSGGRRTLPICLGRERSLLLLKLAIALSGLLVLLFLWLFFPGGVWAAVLLPLLFLTDPRIGALFRGRLLPESRIASMQGILSACVKLNGLYAAGILLHALNL